MNIRKERSYVKNSLLSRHFQLGNYPINIPILHTLSCMTRHVSAKEKQKKYIFTGYSSGWNSRHFPFAVFSYEWCVLPQSVKSKMEALTPKSAIRYMVTALYIQVNINDRQEKKWNHKHTNKNPRLWAMAFDHELVNIPIFISWEKDLLPPTWNSLMMLENPRCSSFIPW